MSAKVIPRLSLATWEEWQEAYDSAVERHFFLSPLWGRAVQAAYPKMLPCPLRFTFPEGQAVLPCLIHRRVRGAFLGLRSMPPYHYGGVLADRPLDSAMAAGIARRLSRCARIHTLIIAVSPGMVVEAWSEFRANAFTTHIVDLTGGYAAVWERLPKRRRTAIRKAERSGVSVRKDNSPSGVASFYRLYQLSCRRWNVQTPDPKAFYDTLIGNSRGSANLWLASLNGQDVSARLIGDNGRDLACGLAAPSDPEYWQYRPNDLIFAAVVEDACARGIRYYDLLPSAQISGVERFKEGSGAVKTPVIEYWLTGLLPSLKRQVGSLIGSRPTRGAATDGEDGENQ